MLHDYFVKTNDFSDLFLKATKSRTDTFCFWLPGDTEDRFHTVNHHCI